MAQFNRTRDRNLSAPELAAFLKRVQAQPIDVKRDALEACICMGGQRPTQLLRLRRTDVDLSAQTVTLYDPKGRRQQPRIHVVPLTKRAVETLERRIANLTGNAPAFSTDGCSGMDLGTLTNYVTAVSDEMVKRRRSTSPSHYEISGGPWKH